MVQDEIEISMGNNNYLLNGEREHIPSVDCWCKPYQDEICPDVWIHNELPIGNA